MITILTKKELRKQALEFRNSISFTNSLRNLSSCIVSKILNSSDFKNAKNIALYSPIKNEIDITSIMKVDNKNYYLPRCNSDELEFSKFTSFDDLKENKWHILEPQLKPINPIILDVIYIPAVMANSKLYRLGYGKGYYDRFFKKNKLTAKKILVLSKKFINDEFVQDNFDIPCDEIIHE